MILCVGKQVTHPNAVSGADATKWGQHAIGYVTDGMNAAAVRRRETQRPRGRVLRFLFDPTSLLHYEEEKRIMSMGWEDVADADVSDPSRSCVT